MLLSFAWFNVSLATKGEQGEVGENWDCSGEEEALG